MEFGWHCLFLLPLYHSLSVCVNVCMYVCGYGAACHNRLESTYAEKCQKFVSEHTKNSKDDSSTCVEIRCCLPLSPLSLSLSFSLSLSCSPSLSAHFSSPICSVPKIKCAQRKQTVGYHLKAPNGICLCRARRRRSSCRRRRSRRCGSHG